MLIEPKAACFHMVAWFLPFVLTIIIMAINRVDASSLYGKHCVDRAEGSLLPHGDVVSATGPYHHHYGHQ